MADQERGHVGGRGRGRGRGHSVGRCGSISPRRGATYVVKKTIRDVGNAQFPVLTRTNYAEWEVLVKVMFKARGLWKAVCDGTDDEEEDQLATEGILKAVPAENRVALGNKESAKEAWDALKAMRLGSERARGEGAAGPPRLRGARVPRRRGRRGLCAAPHQHGHRAGGAGRGGHREGCRAQVPPLRPGEIRPSRDLD